jgi:hypothetical protein
MGSAGGPKEWITSITSKRNARMEDNDIDEKRLCPNTQFCCALTVVNPAIHLLVGLVVKVLARQN